MRIRSLKSKEDFYGILHKTLLLISKDKTLSDHIQCNSKSPQERIVNEFLNFICLNTTPISAFDNLYQEYSFTSVKWRKPIQKLLAYLSIHRYSRVLLSQRKITLPVSLPEEVLIIGGNHRLRFYNFKTRTMYVALKAGDNSEFIEHEIELRKNHSITYAPQFIASGKYWFSESLVIGKPLNRYPISNWQKNLISTINTKHENELILPNLLFKNTQDYIANIDKEISNYLSNISSLSGYVSKIRDIMKKIEHFQAMKIPIAPTHGDLQMGNILVAKNGKYSIIDWECSCHRFFLYDDFVLFSNIRQGEKSEQVFENYIYNFKQRLNYKKYTLEILSFLENEPLVKYLLFLEEIRFTVFNNFSSKNNNKNNLAEAYLSKLIDMHNTSALS